MTEKPGCVLRHDLRAKVNFSDGGCCFGLENLSPMPGRLSERRHLSAYGSRGVVRPLGAVQAKVAHTFHHFDANRSGFLDHSELRSALRHYGLSDLTVEGAQVSAVDCR